MGIYTADCELGRGLFVDRPYGAGETICVLGGAIITLAEVIAKGEAEADPLQIGPDAYIDLVEPFRCLNHSCKPNVGVQDDVFLVALRAIIAHEELRFDYSTTMGEARWTMQCHCGSELCRGVVEDFERLPEELRNGYLGMRIVQGFLRTRFPGRGGGEIDGGRGSPRFWSERDLVQARFTASGYSPIKS
jgi:hypothetical protein